jgi:hypothetical protein
MVKSRASRDQSIHVSNGYAQRQAAPRQLKQTATPGTVQVELVFDPHLQGWDDKRLVILHAADVAEKARVQNGMNHGAS